MAARISLGLLLVATMVVAASVAGRRPSNSPRPAPAAASIAAEDPIDFLDRCVQERLHNHSGNGLARVVEPLSQLHKFVPKSPREEEALARLRRSGWTVGLYLGSRGLLGREPAASGDDRAIRWPVAIAGGGSPDELPPPGDLRELGRRALIASDTVDRGTGSLGRWSVYTSAVRADRKTCLQCHFAEGGAGHSPEEGAGKGSLRVGDVLGVAIYVYERGRADPSADPGS